MEWILTNGIGGYAMGTVVGNNTRRYHGHLVAATKAPAIRTVLLAGVEAYATVGGDQIGLSSNQYVGTVHPEGYRHLESFEIGESAQWTWVVAGQKITKTLTLTEGENTVTIAYRNEGTKAITLSLRPLVSHKFYHENFRVTDFYPEFLYFPEDRTTIEHGGIKLHIDHAGASRTPSTGWYYRFESPRELERGLDGVDDLFCPCELKYILTPGDQAVLVASTLDAAESQIRSEAGGTDSVSVEDSLASAARHFLVQTKSRTSLIAGYPWFTDWGRDTMISLPGICLETGQIEEARAILRAYASQMKQGLIPNRFMDQGERPDYNTVDASLWFGNAVYLTLQAQWDDAFANEALGWLCEIIEWHRKGTLYGIHVDAEDGLVTQGEPGVQLTWMDAKVGDWVVTPRHGKPVEINGLWVNLLRVTLWLGEKLGKKQLDISLLADQAEASMRKKFWHPMVGHFLDTVEPDDASLRPNQLIAMSLPFAPLGGEEAKKALDKIEKELLTPMGLRTLGPREASYVGRFEGPLDKRDAAYHQGTVWPWLLGPFVSAVLRVTGDKKRAQSALTHIVEAVGSYGLDGIAEVYDGDAPQFPGGCPWQAWSVGEVLRAWRECNSGE
ncbi:MAG: glycogen debranching enzyme family protein [Fimbriimonadaceae bacterium]|nr:glycogen debranching enzyme family protein [Fimbriimonadaceae bacterium]